MVKINPQFINRNGKPDLVVLSVRDFRRLVDEAEDSRDLRDLRSARRANKGKKTISLTEMKKKLGL